MPNPTFAEQIASFASESFTDGTASDGTPTAEEQAAAAANKSGEGETAAPAAPAAGGQEGDEGDEGEGEGTEGQEGAEGGEGEAGQPPKLKGRRHDLEAQQAAGKKLAFAERVELADLRIAAGLKPKDRIAELTVLRRGFEREADGHRSRADTEKARADRAEAELAELKSGKATLTPQAAPATGGEGAPDPSQFDYGELDPKYIAALARYETAKALKAHRADDDKKRQDEAAAATQRELGQKQDALVKAGIKLHDDFDDVVMQGAREGKWELSPHLGELLLDSEFGPNIAYELAKDPDEAARVAKLSQVDQAKYLGRQEAKFEAAKSSPGKTPPKAPQAPPPPKTPRGSSGSSKVGADTSDFAALEKAWKSGELR